MFGLLFFLWLFGGHGVIFWEVLRGTGVDSYKNKCLTSIVNLFEHPFKRLINPINFLLVPEEIQRFVRGSPHARQQWKDRRVLAVHLPALRPHWPCELWQHRCRQHRRRRHRPCRPRLVCCHALQSRLRELACVIVHPPRLPIKNYAKMVNNRPGGGANKEYRGKFLWAWYWLLWSWGGFLVLVGQTAPETTKTSTRTTNSFLAPPPDDYWPTWSTHLSFSCFPTSPICSCLFLVPPVAACYYITHVIAMFHNHNYLIKTTNILNTYKRM